MNNPVEEAIGGYIAEENEIAANSRLRRDDVVGASTRKDEGCIGITETQPSANAVGTPTTDQALIEAFNRIMGDVTMPESDAPDYDEWLFNKTWQAALLYMQQHVRPLVEAREALRRLASPEAFIEGGSRMCTEEETARMKYAEQAFNAVLEKE